MPKIVIKNLSDRTIKYENTDASVLKVMHENGVDWMHACGGKGRCTTCSMVVSAGMENLSEHSTVEKKFESLGRLPKDYRLACQTKCFGNVEITVPAAYKLPHLSYSN